MIPATTDIYTLSLHDALPICRGDEQPPLVEREDDGDGAEASDDRVRARRLDRSPQPRSEEHTSELQSQSNLVCRLLLEKKKTNTTSLHQRIADYVVAASTQLV